MKLVFTNDYIYRYASGAVLAVGGAERQQWLLARALAKRGWSVAVAISQGLEAGVRTTIDDVEFVGIGQGHGHILSAWLGFLIREQPTWWYWRCASHLLGPAFTLAKFLGVRTIFSTALDPDVVPRQALCHRTRWWPLYAWGLLWSDKIFVQHRHQFAGLSSNLRSKAYIVPSIAGEPVATKPHCVRSKYLAWVGQLRYAKRPDLLVALALKMPNVHFVVCGGPCASMSPTGYLEPVLKTLRSLPNVDYRGHVSPAGASEVIANAAVLLSTSDEEGFPNVFLQAWSSGTPVISLNIDPDDVIENMGLGIVSGSVECAITDTMFLLDSAQRRDDIAARARCYVMENHSESAVTTTFDRALGFLS